MSLRLSSSFLLLACLFFLASFANALFFDTVRNYYLIVDDSNSSITINGSDINYQDIFSWIDGNKSSIVGMSTSDFNSWFDGNWINQFHNKEFDINAWIANGVGSGGIGLNDFNSWFDGNLGTYDLRGWNGQHWHSVTGLTDENIVSLDWSKLLNVPDLNGGGSGKTYTGLSPIIVDNDLNEISFAGGLNIDGGFANSVYLFDQNFDGGGA